MTERTSLAVWMTPETEAEQLPPAGAAWAYAAKGMRAMLAERKNADRITLFMII